MTELPCTLEYFRDTAIQKLYFLESKGFHRAVNFEDTLPTGGTAIFQGSNVTFIFSLDIRDNCIDAEVVCRDTRSMNKEDMYHNAQNMIEYLVHNAGYRGGSFSQSKDREHYIDRMMDEWAALIHAFAKQLLGSEIR